MKTKITLTALALATVMAALPAADAQAQNSRAILENSGKLDLQKRTSRGSSSKIIRVPGSDPKAQKNHAILEKHGKRPVFKRSKVPTKPILQPPSDDIGYELPDGVDHKSVANSVLLPDLIVENPSYSETNIASICVRNIGQTKSKPNDVMIAVRDYKNGEWVNGKYKTLKWPGLKPGQSYCLGAHLKANYGKGIYVGAGIVDSQPELDYENNGQWFVIYKNSSKPAKIGSNN